MPQFRWKGRDAAGRTIEGEMSASGPAPSSARPEERRTLTEVLARGRTQGPRPIRGVLLTLGLLAGAAVIGLLAPIVVCRCERTPDGRVDCSVGERVLGLVTLREETLAGVTSVDTESKTFVTATSGEEERRRYGRTRSWTGSRIVLSDGQGRSIRPRPWDQGGTMGATSESMQDALTQFLSASDAGPLVLWQGQWVPLAIPIILVGLALLTLALSILAVSSRGTHAVYGSMGRLAAAVDQRRRQGNP